MLLSKCQLRTAVQTPMSEVPPRRQTPQQAVSGRQFLSYPLATPSLLCARLSALFVSPFVQWSSSGWLNPYALPVIHASILQARICWQEFREFFLSSGCFELGSLTCDLLCLKTHSPPPNSTPTTPPAHPPPQHPPPTHTPPPPPHPAPPAHPPATAAAHRTHPSQSAPSTPSPPPLRRAALTTLGLSKSYGAAGAAPRAP